MRPSGLARLHWLSATLWVLVTSPLWAQEDEAMRRALAILRTAPILDTHNDLPWVIRARGKPPRDVDAFDISRRALGDTDLPRLRRGMVGTQFWSVWVPSTLSPLDAMRTQLEQIDIARRLTAKYPNDLGFATSTADIRRELARGRIGCLLGIEGGHTIVNSLGALRTYYDLGVRYMTLTHFQGNDWADAATDTARHGGLTAFGREVVREMNRLGMLVDISHVSPAAMSDAIDVTEAPVIFSHSSARALTDHVRNVPDSILRRLPANGGVVMVAFIPAFISEPARKWRDPLFSAGLRGGISDTAWQRMTREHIAQYGPAPRATVEDIADHVEHIRNVAGVDHVGIGADFAGAEPEAMPQGLEDVSKYPALFAELIRRGWSDSDLRKLARENFVRAFRQTERVSTRLRKTRTPSNATIQEMDRRPAS